MKRREFSSYIFAAVECVLDVLPSKHLKLEAGEAEPGLIISDVESIDKFEKYSVTVGYCKAAPSRPPGDAMNQEELTLG
ncbi:hypothetical protein K443DRAFT_686201 [Laccaria amethystina LaAM-08-1]|uniref:Uncharacterized protein n=1 Tax=Laccaria amethystina LaAM-08-1 TaxID=1095629 RepID=A0A0C9X3X8_9AGAR|nr:hypothetical protein K443DRAFT_686201 [Laccaria amethystina LaAM-08-1]